MAVSGLTITALGSDNEKNELAIKNALKNGGIVINSIETVMITPDVMEIVSRISQSKEPFKKPILIFMNDQIEIKDRNKFEDIMSRPSQTVTSL